ncbi:transposase [Saccharopolyspora sp. NPDC050642]|uniref:transposase n=1 Tax=Saccharopolyspora sp. NPDC050642 TaxID=3157099 RepID=UPI00340AEBD3
MCGTRGGYPLKHRRICSAGWSHDCPRWDDSVRGGAGVCGGAAVGVQVGVGVVKRRSEAACQRRRGRKPGEQKALSAHQQRRLRYAVAEHVPTTFGLTGASCTSPSTPGSFNARVFLPFLDRLTRYLGRKVHLIVDGHPVHRRKIVQQWIGVHAEAIEMDCPPGYSPELNPDVILNANLKRAVSTNAAPKTPAELEHAVRSFLHRLQELPGRVCSYFGKPAVRYAA